jgi:hypothetical protein
MRQPSHQHTEGQRHLQLSAVEPLACISRRSFPPHRRKFVRRQVRFGRPCSFTLRAGRKVDRHYPTNMRDAIAAVFPLPLLVEPLLACERDGGCDDPVDWGCGAGPGWGPCGFWGLPSRPEVYRHVPLAAGWFWPCLPRPPPRSFADRGGWLGLTTWKTLTSCPLPACPGALCSGSFFPVAAMAAFRVQET